jgi:hypothetical protein
VYGCSANFSLYLEAISSAYYERKQVCFALELVHSFRDSALFSANFSATVCFGAEVVQIWWPVLWRQFRRMYRIFIKLVGWAKQMKHLFLTLLLLLQPEHWEV